MGEDSMIIINSRCDTITIPVANRCNLPPDEKYFLLLKNTFTKDVFVIRFYERVHHEFISRKHYQWLEFKVSFPDYFPYGEYEYFLTPDNLLQVTFDINNISYIENNSSMMFDTECGGDLFRDMRIISTGIVKFNENPFYHERNKQTESEYTGRG